MPIEPITDRGGHPLRTGDAVLLLSYEGDSPMCKRFAAPPMNLVDTECVVYDIKEGFDGTWMIQTGSWWWPAHYTQKFRSIGLKGLVARYKEQSYG